MKKTKDQNEKHTIPKANKGITLIALVITIIVMLILVAVTITMAVNGGLFNYVGKAVKETQNAINDEQTLANGKINVDGVWYDSIGDYVNNIPSEEGNEGIISEEITGADGQFKYVKLKNGRIQICRYIGTGTSIVIPATYDGYTVYSVGNINAGSNKNQRYNIFGATNSLSNTTAKSITISEGIKEIGTAAFYGCTGLTGDLKLPSTLKRIGDFSFYNCKNLNGTLTIQEGVKIIDFAAFNGCSNLTGELILPSTLTKLGQYSFNGCSKLTGDLKIPEGVTVIGRTAFQNCSGLNGELIIPNTIQKIEDFAFNHCTAFTNTSLTIPKSVTEIGTNGAGTHIFYDFANATITEFIVEKGNTAFQAIDGVLYNIEGTRLIAYPTSKPGDTYTIPEGVTLIDELGFSHAGYDANSQLRKLELPNSYILTTELPSNYINVGNNLAVGLYKYTGVNEIVVKEDNPNYKTEDGILYSKDGTTLWYVPLRKTGDIVIPEGVTTIKSGAFYSAWDRAHSSITIPASVTEIESTELNELKTLGSSKVTFEEGCIYQFDASGNIVKNS